MADDRAIRTFNTFRRRALLTPTWRLRIWTHWARYRRDRRWNDTNLLRLIALQHELRHRPG